MDIFTKLKHGNVQAEEARRLGIYPYFHALESRQDVEVIMEGKRRIMLGSNNYLGLTTNPRVIEAGIKAIEKYGTGCSGSRSLRQQDGSQIRRINDGSKSTDQIRAYLTA